MNKPDYTTLKDKSEFVWYVNMSYYTMAELADVTLNDLFTNYKASLKLYSKENFERFYSRFPMHDKLRKLNPATPPISYGHIDGLGVELVFPEGNGEVNYKRSDRTYAEWIKILCNEIDFSKQGLAPYYLEYKDKMSKAMDNRKIGFSYGYEGPITTAYTMMDLKLYYDLYDEPDLLKEFLRMLSISITQFKKFHCDANGSDYKNTSYMCDDCAALISADMWEDFVIPYMDIVYSDVGASKRSLHSEGMIYKHLKSLETLGITWFDPSVSPKLDPLIISKNCAVPFIWRMCEIYHSLLDKELAMDFVFSAVRDGANGLFTTVRELSDHDIAVVEGFIEACEIVETMKKQGADNHDVGKLVSKRGQAIFWDRWRNEFI
ncbi:MAG TPA: uroporphyrinogen decarboxylase family protein [Clostridia bacterium]|jgi:hypothetical protein|nr:MAG: Uroporphyrinogen decarboxylase (URO-D) [Firmicutes bacterium ADurb.Bin146]HOD93996.1 uroporphyrinogen decarboxylase family protein [Clostridia bacterium]